jgi:hypothetical protein
MSFVEKSSQQILKCTAWKNSITFLKTELASHVLNLK